MRRARGSAPKGPMSGFVRGCGVLIILRSVTNFAKLWQGDGAVLVLFGQIVHGGAVAVPAVVIGVLMFLTGTAMLIGSRWAGPLVAAYAVYVLVNLAAWTVTNPGEIEHVGRRLSSATDPTTLRWVGAAGFLIYCLVALATTALPAWMLYRRRA